MNATIKTDQNINTIDGMPSLALHVFSALVIAMLVIFKESNYALLYFLIPALCFATPIFVYSRESVNVFLLGQYILISVYALCITVNPALTGGWLVTTILFLNLLKLPRSVIIPPLGPAFFYVCLSSQILKVDIVELSPIFTITSLFLVAKNKLPVTPLFPSLGILFILWKSNDSDIFFVLSCASLLIIVYLCRAIRMRASIANLRVTIFEEVFASLVLVLLANRVFDIEYRVAYLGLFSIYTATAAVSVAKGKSALSNIATCGSVFSAFMALNLSDVSGFTIFDNAATAIGVSAVMATAVLAAEKYRLDQLSTVSKVLLAAQMLVLYKTGDFLVSQLAVANANFFAGAVLFLFAMTLARQSDYIKRENVWDGLFTLRDLVRLRRWVRSSKSVLSNLPVIGLTLAASTIFLYRLRSAFDNGRYWKINHATVVVVCFTGMLLTKDWAWTLFRAWPIDAAGSNVEQYLNLQTEPLRKLYTNSFTLAAFAIFGAVLGIVGARTRFAYLKLLGIFVPLIGILLSYMSSISSPWPLFFLSLSLLYLAVRFSTGSFIESPNSKPKAVAMKVQSARKVFSSSTERTIPANCRTFLISWNDATGSWTAESDGSHSRGDGYDPQSALKSLLTTESRSSSSGEFLESGRGNLGQ